MGRKKKIKTIHTEDIVEKAVDTIDEKHEENIITDNSEKTPIEILIETLVRIEEKCDNIDKNVNATMSKCIVVENKLDEILSMIRMQNILLSKSGGQINNSNTQQSSFSSSSQQFQKMNSDGVINYDAIGKQDITDGPPPMI